MKKLIYSLIGVSLMSTGFTMSAQSEAVAQESGYSKTYLPEKGDFAVGVDLVPLFRTIGGAFNNSETPIGGTPYNYDDMDDFRPTVSVMGKYMLTDKWGLRLNLGLKVKSKSSRSYVADDKALYLNPMSESTVVNKETRTQSGGSLQFGAEYRLGKRRVQGVFGFGAMFGFSKTNTSYSYGNNITDFNRYPTGSIYDDYLPAGYRVTDRISDGVNCAVGVYGSVGAEWFVAPKVSLGAEVNVSLYGVFGANTNVKGEGYNEAYKKITTWTERVSPGDRSINFGTDNLGGALYMSFYF